jgi:hypothetical protein
MLDGRFGGMPFIISDFMPVCTAFESDVKISEKKTTEKDPQPIGELAPQTRILDGSLEMAYIMTPKGWEIAGHGKN